MGRNPFNLKEMTKNMPNCSAYYNPSYKVIDERNLIIHESAGLINKKYYSVASGNEGGGEENIRGHIKNIAEEDLMKTEDEIHEFDTVIQRFKITRLFLERILKNKLSQN